MYRYLLLLAACGCVAQAASVTSVSCTLGTQTINASTDCLIPFVTSSGSGDIEAHAHVTWSAGNVTAEANGGATGDPGVAWNVSMKASDTTYYTTAGPVRPGLILITANAFGGFANVTVANFAGDVGGQFPFQLGTTFAASVVAWTGAGPGSPASDSIASYTFSLYETNGTPVPLLIASSPEPMSGTLLLAGLGAASLLSRKRLRA